MKAVQMQSFADEIELQLKAHLKGGCHVSPGLS
jgi:hypothetical protein